MQVKIVTHEKSYGIKGREVSVKKIELIPENPEDRKHLQDFFWNCRYGRPPVITVSIDTDKWDGCTLTLNDRAS